MGTGKITKKEMLGIPHYLLDVANPKRKFSVSQYQKLGLGTIKKIQKKNKLPIIVGGTGFYIQSIVDGIVLPEVKPNWVLRNKLEKKSEEALYALLFKKDPARAKIIDQHNKRRLVRALEIIQATKKPITPLKKQSNFDVLQIGILKTNNDLKKLIHKRLVKRIKYIIIEVKKLHKNGLSFKRLEEFGLEYRFIAQYLQNKISYQEMMLVLEKEIQHFAKRQMTWFKRDKKIHWISKGTEARKILDKFIGKRIN